MKDRHPLPKETVTFRNEKGELVTKELDDGVSFDTVVGARPPKTKKRGPDLTTRRAKLRKLIWEVIAENQDHLPQNVPELARKVLDKDRAISDPSMRVTAADTYKSLEIIIRRILEEKDRKE